MNTGIIGLLQGSVESESNKRKDEGTGGKYRGQKGGILILLKRKG